MAKTARFEMRMDADLLQRVEEQARRDGISRAAWIEECITMRLAMPGRAAAGVIATHGPQAETIKRERRNRFGVKDSSDMYRTINGAHYICWLSSPSEERIAAYKAAGIRCARRGVELFVHHMDTDEAAKVDAVQGNR